MEEKKKEPAQKKSAAKHAKKQKMSVLRKIVFGIALVVFLGSLGYIINELIIIPNQNKQSIGKFQELYKTSSQSSSSAQSSQPGEKVILEKFKPLLELNEDTIGWLNIPNTSVDFPVFYKPDGNNFYLKRDAQKNDNKLGSLYIGDNCSMDPMSKALVMYGHNMEDNDEMFGQLMKYKKIEFLQENPVFTFDTLYEEAQWKIIAVVRASVNDMDKSQYVYWRSEYSDQGSFDAFVKESRVRSMYNIEDDTTFDDQLMVFSTCDYAFWGDRLVIVSRRLREGETEESVRQSRIEKNEVTKYSQLYYDFYGGSAPSEAQIENNYATFYHTEAN